MTPLRSVLGLLWLAGAGARTFRGCRQGALTEAVQPTGSAGGLDPCDFFRDARGLTRAGVLSVPAAAVPMTLRPTRAARPANAINFLFIL